jgi:hypothetical protein
VSKKDEIRRLIYETESARVRLVGNETLMLDEVSVGRSEMANAIVEHGKLGDISYQWAARLVNSLSPAILKPGVFDGSTYTLTQSLYNGVAIYIDQRDARIEERNHVNGEKSTGRPRTR